MTIQGVAVPGDESPECIPVPRQYAANDRLIRFGLVGEILTQLLLRGLLHGASVARFFARGESSPPCVDEDVGHDVRTIGHRTRNTMCGRVCWVGYSAPNRAGASIT